MPTILLAEDDTMSRDIIKTRLARRGFEVDAVTNGAEALKAAESQSYDLIILDLSMPEMDGFETVRALKSSSATRHTPTLALSAHSMDRDRQKALDAGFDDFDAKPVDIKRLLKKIDTLLGTSESD